MLIPFKKGNTIVNSLFTCFFIGNILCEFKFCFFQYQASCLKVIFFFLSVYHVMLHHVGVCVLCTPYPVSCVQTQVVVLTLLSCFLLKEPPPLFIQRSSSSTSQRRGLKCGSLWSRLRFCLLLKLIIQMDRQTDKPLSSSF